MLEKLKRKNKLRNNQERQLPANIQELINRYDLDNDKVYDYIETIIDDVNDIDSKLNSIEIREDGKIYNGKSGEQLIEANEIFFKSGETYSFERYYTGGFVTTGKTDILFSIPMPKRMDNVTPSITAGKITIRDVNGNYLKTTDNINNASITIYKEKGWISLLLRYSSALSTTNNTPVAIYIQDVNINFI